MRQICALLIALLLLPIFAAAQDPAGVGSSPRVGSNPYSRYEFNQWQLAVGYQYNRFNLLGKPFNTHGLDTTVTRFFGKWFGLDGQAGAGFGNTGTSSVPPNLAAHSVFLGGGPRLAYRNHTRIEPWVHGVIGWEDFRFTQTAGFLGSNSSLAWAAGGGGDFFLTSNVAVRVEADAMQTRLFSATQRHFQMVSGLVLNF